MADYENFPPYKYFLRILKTAPKASLLYIELWKKRSKSLKITLSKYNIRKEYLISPTLFRNNICLLRIYGLLEYVEIKDEFYITLHGNDDQKQ
jgi:hypothetical protein